MSDLIEKKEALQTSDNDTPLVEVKNLKEYFNINVGLFKTKPLKAVDGVSFSIKKGETLGLVGRFLGCVPYPGADSPGPGP